MGADDDGQTGGRPEPPKGYEDKWFNLMAACAEGRDQFDAAWQQADGPFKTYTVKHNKAAFEALKTQVYSARPKS